MNALAMRTLTLACIFGLVAGCGGRREPAADKGSAVKRGPRLQVTYDIDLDKAVDDKAADVRRDLEAALADQKVVATVRVSMVPGELTVTPADPSTKAAIEQLVKNDYGDTIESQPCDASAGPAAICIKVAASYAEAVKKSALTNAVATIRARLVAAKVADPTVVEKAGQIVVEFPANDEQGLALRSLVARAGNLEFKVVDDGSNFMKRLFAHIGTDGAKGDPTEPRALAEDIRAEIDQWRPDDGGSHTDYYLISHDREAVVTPERARQIGCSGPKVDDQVRCRVGGRTVIEQYLQELATKDPSFQVPDDRQIGYEVVEPPPEAVDQRPYWRTYYLERAVRLTGKAIANARGSFDPNTNRPIVLVEFNRAGATTFGELTAQIVGRKLATIVDGRIKSAPIVNGAIRGGRISITMGGSDATRQELERDELVSVLKTGALPAPLRESSASQVP